MPDAGTIQHQALEEPAIDPVCGMRVDRATAKHRFDHDHQTWFFCGARCREKFAAGPDAYLAPKAEPTATDAVYTCPMHPEVRQTDPEAARSAAWRWSR